MGRGTRVESQTLDGTLGVFVGTLEFSLGGSGLSAPSELELNEQRICLRWWLQEADIWWDRVDYVYLRRACDERLARSGELARGGSLKGDPLDWHVAFQSKTATSLKLSPVQLTSLQMAQVIEWVLSRSPQALFDPGFILFYGLVLRLHELEPDRLLVPGSLIDRPPAGPDSAFVRHTLLYLTGRAREAKTDTSSGAPGSSSWDARLLGTLLCRAGVPETPLDLSLGLDAPAAVAAAIERARDVAPSAWYDPTMAA
jgi:hypothetical protein